MRGRGSPGAFKASYTARHQRLFLDQAYGLATAGFVPGTAAADPAFPLCLQCAALDRARRGRVARSPGCAQCFAQYCYDAARPPSAADVPGRRMRFVDPDPPALARAEAFAARAGVGLGVGLGGALLVGAGVCVFW